MFFSDNFKSNKFLKNQIYTYIFFQILTPAVNGQLWTTLATEILTSIGLTVARNENIFLGEGRLNFFLSK